MLKIIKQIICVVSLLSTTLFPMHKAVSTFAQRTVLKNNNWRLFKRSFGSFINFSGDTPVVNIPVNIYDNHTYKQPIFPDMKSDFISDTPHEPHSPFPYEKFDPSDSKETLKIHQYDLFVFEQQIQGITQKTTAMLETHINKLSINELVKQKATLEHWQKEADNKLNNLNVQTIDLKKPSESFGKMAVGLDPQEQNKLRADIQEAIKLESSKTSFKKALEHCNNKIAQFEKTHLPGYRENIQSISNQEMLNQELVAVTREAKTAETNIHNKLESNPNIFKPQMNDQVEKLGIAKHKLTILHERMEQLEQQQTIEIEHAQEAVANIKQELSSDAQVIADLKSEQTPLSSDAEKLLSEAKVNIKEFANSVRDVASLESYNKIVNLLNRSTQEKLNINWEAIPKELGLDTTITTTEQIAQAAIKAHESGNTKGSIIIADFGNAMLDFVSTVHHFENNTGHTKNAMPIGQIAYEKMSNVFQSLKTYTLSPNTQAYLATACLTVPQLQGLGITIHGLNALGKVLASEIVGTAGLLTVEMAEISTVCGVTMPAPMAKIAQEAIDQGRLAATQEAIKDFVQLFEAPFLSGCTEKVLNLEHGLPTIESVATEAGSFDMSKHVANAEGASIGEAVPSKVNFKEYWESLIKDSANGGKITAQTIDEAFAGITAEQKGFLKGPLTRDPIGAAEFYDKFGQAWDVKAAISYAKNGKYIFNPEQLLKKIKMGILLGEKIILDITKLMPNDFKALYEKLIKQLTPEEINKIIVVAKDSTIKQL